MSHHHQNVMECVRYSRDAVHVTMTSRLILITFVSYSPGWGLYTCLLLLATSTSTRAAFTYEPFLSSKKSIATHHARQRSSILQHEIPHSRMLERRYEHSQTPICPGIWGINSSRGNSRRYLLEVLQKQRWRQQLASQLSTTEDTGGGKVNSHFIY